MKFTKESCFEQIKALLGQTKLTSDRTINERLDTLIPLVANEEMELADFIEKVKADFNTFEANLKHENSVFVKNFKPVEPPPPPAVVQPQADALTAEQMLAIIQKANQPLLDRISQMEQEKTISETLKGVDGIIGTWGVNPDRKGVLEIAKEISLSKIGENDTAESLAETVKKNYERMLAASNDKNGYTPIESKRNPNDVDNDVLEVLKLIEASEKESSEFSVKDALGFQ